MAKEIIEESKSVYYKARKDKNWTRDQASEALGFISPERLERIENKKMDAHPDEVLQMSKVYGVPDLCNYFCAHECQIGQEYVPEIKIKDLSQIVLQMVASLNTLDHDRNRLIEIAADGEISGEELKDFIHIQNELEKISITVEALQLWSEKMVAGGVIDKEEYLKLKEK